MFIQLSDTRAITSDANQFMHCKWTKSKNKKTGVVREYWQPYLYYTSLKTLIRHTPMQVLKESDAEGWNDCKEILEDTRQLIVDVFGDYK